MIQRGAPGRRWPTVIEVAVGVCMFLFFADGTLAYDLMGIRSDAKVDMAVITMGKIDQKMKIFGSRNDRYPSSLDELYLGEESPVDSWGHAYLLVEGGGEHGYDIVSLGADGRPGGTGASADVRLSDFCK